MSVGTYIDDAVGLLRRMVAIPSPSFREKDVADAICGTLDGWGLAYLRTGDNIVLKNRSYDPSRPSLAMDAHIDTVEAAPDYTRDPFDPGNDDAVVFGLGSNDDGGSVAAMLAAFRYFYDAPFNLILSLSAEEERSGSGGAEALYGPGGLLSGPEVAWVIVGEPTGMRAATSERGLLVLDGRAAGVSGHAARDEGVNALYVALDDIDRLRSHRFAKVSPLMGEVKLNVTQINAGSAHNVIPDSCDFVVDIRPTELYTPEELLSELRALCRSELVPRKLDNRSSATFEGSPLLTTLQGLGVQTFSSPTTSDWVRIHKDCIKMGPGESSRSHRPDEYILRSEIGDAVEKYIRFISAFYGNIME